MLENSTSPTACSPLSSIFQVNFVFFQPLNFLLPKHNFQLFPDLLITLTIWALFQLLVSSVKDENFQSNSVFYLVVRT